jgi:hypothetical protein
MSKEALSLYEASSVVDTMKLALEYMDGTLVTDHLTGYERKRFVMDALRQAIHATELREQAEQAQPVAWRMRCTDPMRDWALMYRYPKSQEKFLNIEIQPLYTAPPPRQPLADEQLRDALRTCPHDTVENLRVRWLYAKDFARAIEAAHGIKE